MRQTYLSARYFRDRMQIEFNLVERLAGFIDGVEPTTNKVRVISRELVGPTDPINLLDRLGKLQDTLFSKIPSLPSPGQIESLLIMIRKDLSATAYVNELGFTMQVKAARDVKAGDPVYISDIADIIAAEPNIDIPDDVAVVIVRSFEWKRSLFYDLTPILPNNGPREYSLAALLARQTLLLLGISPGGTDSEATGPTRILHMQAGLDRLRELLSRKVESEKEYQELLQKHPWMLGGTYAEIRRHSKLDDANIPDFTALRHDKFNDVIEIKQPFLKLFRADGGFTAEFNEAWEQAERYLRFTIRQRQYLRDEKDLRFENPRCILVIGYALDERKLASLRDKQFLKDLITIFTYDHLLETARYVFDLVRRANERVFPWESSLE